MTTQFLVIVGLILSTAMMAPGQNVSIAACGETVPADQTGVVAGDLTCATGAGTFVVGVEDRGTLDLAGHTLTGAATGVRCASRCTVTSTVGTGTIRNAETAGIAVVGRRGRVELSNLSLEDNPSAGVLTDFLTGKVRGTQVNLTGSGIGIQASQIRLVGLSATGNYRVVQARKAILQDSTIAASADTAISGHKAILTNSSVTGSGSGIDLLTEWRPRVTNSTCGVSRKLSNDTQTWSVCAND